MAFPTHIVAALWVPKEKVLDYITSPVLRFRFEKILNFAGKVTHASFVTKPEFFSEKGSVNVGCENPREKV